MSIVKELWDGNIKPRERNPFINPQFSELSKHISKNREKLAELLPDEGKDILNKLIIDYSEMNAIYESEGFASGFRLGAKLMLETMQDA